MADQDDKRRVLLKGIGALPLLSVLNALQGCGTRWADARKTYGPIAPVADLSTGLPLLQLPQGFSYTSYGWTGDIMSNGLACPARHDGMGVVQRRRSGGRDELVLIRNHEVALGRDANYFGAPAVYDRGEVAGRYANGGTVNLRFSEGKWIGMAPSLGGTLVNCAGGATPWGTWLTCEEVGADAASSAGRKHGYVFEVAADPAQTDAKPIVGMGRFKHEAVAIDPETGIVYMTEDEPGRSGFYRYVPNTREGRLGSLHEGGTLQMAKVADRNNIDLAGARAGDNYPIEWLDIAAPDENRGAAHGPAGVTIQEAAGPFVQGWRSGALRMNRGEGIAWHDGAVYVMDTAGGPVQLGAIWMLDLRAERLRCIYASPGMLFCNMGDNITVGPNGGLLICEDGMSPSMDRYGMGQRLLALSTDGELSIFAKNNYKFDRAQLQAVGKSPKLAGDMRGAEFCGACFDLTGRYLFVNQQNPGITFAITGPWERGRL